MIDRRMLIPTLGGGVVAQPITVTAVGVATPTARRLYFDNMVFFWVRKTGGGSPAIDDDFNCSSITDTGVGRFTPNIATAFSNATYGGGLGHIVSTTSIDADLCLVSPATTSFEIANRDNAGGLKDGNSDFHVLLLGDN